MQAEDEYYNLIARCAIRDQSALEQLYREVGPYLNNVAYNILKSEDLSNDVLQEAFVQIWQNAADYRLDKAKPKTWMTSIVRYRALDRLAKERKHSDRITENTEEVDQLDNIASDNRPDTELQKSQKNRLLTECLETLTERTKNCIQLAYLQGYSREEIAEKLTTNTNTVKSWLRRGSERLKQCMESKVEAKL